MSRFEVFDGLESLRPDALHDPVCTVGVFDGVHRGHRQLIYELRVWAKAVEGQTCVVTFPRHPLEVLKGVEVDSILTVENRLEEFERHGIDAVALIDFAAVQDLAPADFLQQVLVERLGCRRMLLGFDSRLGKGAAGTPENLPAIGEQVGVEIRIASGVHDKHGTKVGSRFIRDAIRKGDLEAAANALGRPFSLRGTVVHGSGRGAGLGVATANVEVAGQVLPPDGVYLVRVYRGGETAAGVANLGVKPTFGAGAARALEVHVPGWEGELYGHVLEVRLGRFLRPETRFDDAAALKEQIAKDLDELARAMAAGEI